MDIQKPLFLKKHLLVNAEIKYCFHEEIVKKEVLLIVRAYELKR